MIIVLKQNTKPEQLENLEAWIHSMGIETHVSIGKTREQISEFRNVFTAEITAFHR